MVVKGLICRCKGRVTWRTSKGARRDDLAGRVTTATKRIVRKLRQKLALFVSCNSVGIEVDAH